MTTVHMLSFGYELYHLIVAYGVNLTEFITQSIPPEFDMPLLLQPTPVS